VCLLADGLDGLRVVVGASELALQSEEALLSLHVGDESVQLVEARQSLSSGELARLYDLSLLLATHAFTSRVQQDTNASEFRGLLTTDRTITIPERQGHLILVGGPGSNLCTALAFREFEAQFGRAPMIGPCGALGQHPTVFSNYSFESRAHNDVRRIFDVQKLKSRTTGYLLLSSNPWNPQKALLVVAGIQSSGVQAALLALLEREDRYYDSDRIGAPWRSLGGGNRYAPNVSAKVVQAISAMRVVDNEPNSESQRWITISNAPELEIVSDFEFVE
jgi:hypothetical protein